MKRFTKKRNAIIAFVLISTVAISAMLINNSLLVEANELFSGIDSIISYNSEANPFNIVELVPEEKMAEIGYLMDGEEPEQWLSSISTMVSSSDDSGYNKRTKYVNDLKTKLTSIIETNGTKTKPLHYSDYEESYVSSSGLIRLPLANEDVIEKDTTGYKINDVGTGNGAYEFNCDYTPVATGGNYDQNVDYYIYSGAGYYGVVFEGVLLDGISSIAEQLAGRKAYSVKNSHAYVNKSSLEGLASDKPNAYVYKSDNSDISLPYEFVGRAGDMINMLDNLDYDKYTYFTLEMEYVPAESVVEGNTYYLVQDGGVTFYPNCDGEYGAALDVDNPYIENEDGMGNFILDLDSQIYSYVGDGNGRYELVVSSSDKLDYPVKVNSIYYKGGFKNNNWFQNGVFNQNDKLDKDLFFNVETVDCDLFKFKDISNVNLLYISGKTSKLTSDCDVKFSSHNDIDWDTVIAVVTKVTNHFVRLPVIVDYSQIKGIDVQNGTNLQKLIALLCASNLEELNITEITTESDINWGAIKYASDPDGDGHFVNGSVYAFSGNSKDNIPFIFEKFSTAFVDSLDENSFLTEAKAVGFGEIAESINQENLIRKSENESGANYDYFDLKISKAITIEYIISYVSKRAEKQDTGLKILDIEPSAANSDTPGVLTFNKLKQILGNYCPDQENIEITYITSAEFIGKIQDLNEYDMIYMGLSTEKFNKVDGKTVYNDSKMNGLIYSNIGDICVISPNRGNYTGHAGLFENDYVHDSNNVRQRLDATMPNTSDIGFVNSINTYRYSGNDFTMEKVDAIKRYIKGGFPVVISDDFILNKKVNEDYIDNCSNVYSLLNDILSSEYVMTVSKATKNSENLHKYLTMNKPQLIVSKKQTEPDAVYTKLNSNVISIDFVINNSGGVDLNALFDVTLMLDSNADGKFSITQEAIEANSVKVYKNGKLIHPTLNSDGEYAYLLPAGAENGYSISYTLPDGYVGIIPWKLNVSQSNNSYRYDSDQGYVYKEKTATEKEKIKILQINSSRTSTFNLQSEMANKNSKFHNLAVALEDFELNIKTISAGNYANAYTSTYLDDYDMIILGFGDMYSISDANGCLEGIRNFIEEGNPVLFTHDTTSLSNDSTGHNEWGYEFNTIIRDVVGMDRYASLNNDSVKSGRTICSDRDTAYRYGVWDYSDADAQKYISAIDFAKKNDTDLGYMPKSNKKVICRQNQGFTYLDMARFLSKSYNTYLAYAGLSTGNHSSTKVNQVNSGQITSYPYVLPESFTVSNTHYQYYQLDMNQDSDNDGESDIVVWYALTDNSGPYSLSPNDVRNNYYIYTMGNVTYSGVGHSSISNNVNELKLYINTMIAAYNSGVHAPEVKVLKTADDNSEDVGTLYVSMDDILKEQLDGKDATEDVFFRVDDNNLLRTGSERVEYADFCSVVSEDEYNENSKSTDYLKINEDGATVYLKKLKWDKYSVKDEKIITEGISSGVTYKVKVPLSIIDENHDSLKIYCVAYTRIIKKGVNGSIKKTIDSPVGFDSFRIQRVGLTDLD